MLIAFWDGKRKNGLGGTAEVVNYGRDKGVPLIWIDITTPHKTIYERMEKLTTSDHLKGDISMYEPKPIDTSTIDLSDDLLEMTELLAENAHEHWAKKRVDEGWTYGPNKSDDKKTNPDLVPYDDLPTSEKEYDRTMAMETLKLIRKLGYRIEKI